VETVGESLLIAGNMLLRRIKLPAVSVLDVPVNWAGGYVPVFCARKLAEWVVWVQFLRAGLVVSIFFSLGWTWENKNCYHTDVDIVVMAVCWLNRLFSADCRDEYS